jgi:hypothetical protein
MEMNYRIRQLHNGQLADRERRDGIVAVKPARGITMWAHDRTKADEGGRRVVAA